MTPEARIADDAGEFSMTPEARIADDAGEFSLALDSQNDYLVADGSATCPELIFAIEPLDGNLPEATYSIQV